MNLWKLTCSGDLCVEKITWAEIVKHSDKGIANNPVNTTKSGQGLNKTQSKVHMKPLSKAMSAISQK